MVGSARIATAFLVACLTIGGRALARESAVQCTTPTASQVLVNKDVGEDRWVITYRKSDGLTIGNVFTASGGAVFLQCTRNQVAEGKLTLSCAASGGCSETDCPEFQPLPEPVSVACSFFTAPCSKTPISASLSATCGGSPPKPPYDSEASCANFATHYGCYDHEFMPGSCAVSSCCSAPDCKAP